MNLSKIFLFFCLVVSGLASAQNSELAVVYLQGDIKMHLASESPKKARSLIYGPLTWDHVLILKANARVKILRNNGETCDLSQPGTYFVSKLKFLPKAESSLFSKFGEYFLSFFGTQKSSENKDYHSSSIFAASRGDEDVPLLMFPFKDNVSLDENGIEFLWAHACDTCNFILQIYDFQTRALLFQGYIKSRSYTLEDPGKYLAYGKKYFWNVQLDKSMQKSVSNSFTVAEKGSLARELKNMESILRDNSLQLNSLPAHMLTMAGLLEGDQANFAFQYARRARLANPADTELAARLDAICLSELKKRSMQ